MTESLAIDYYSDLLCVWAWIAERRNHELLETFDRDITIECLFLDLFADTKTRIGEGWKNKGGYEGFAAHVRNAAAPFEEAPIHRDVWEKVRPSTSANAHLVLKAVAQAKGNDEARKLATQLRRCFFAKAIDIGKLSVLYELCDAQHIPVDECKKLIENGTAIAALLADNKKAHEARISGSPTWVLNSGRQTLYGNVGYRVLQANVEELLKRPQHQASWC